MQSSLIGKIQKANLYAREPDRVTFSDFSTTFRGENDTHNVSFRSSEWSCDCHFFVQRHLQPRHGDSEAARLDAALRSSVLAGQRTGRCRQRERSRHLASPLTFDHPEPSAVSGRGFAVSEM
jgi:hypothetical protein